jgi:hypothetical protein
MKYKVGNTEFDTFEQVANWAWNEHKISFEGMEYLEGDEAHKACDELNQILSAPNEEMEESYG